MCEIKVLQACTDFLRDDSPLPVGFVIIFAILWAVVAWFWKKYR
jgi:hypothetical protein